MRRSGLLLLLFCAAAAFGDGTVRELGGHAKLRLVGQSYPQDSVYRDLAGPDSVDAGGELRLDLGLRRAAWALQADYQLLGLYSEFLPFGMPDDENRLFDLTRIISDGTDHAYVHRLDRLWLGYTGDKTVIRVGRQALSWGNGLFFHPLDLVNPFDPTTIDTEYKSGDDMIYGQYLLDSGSDVQAAAVFRRDPASGERRSTEGTLAVKYHGFAGEFEFDVLLGRDYGNTVVGLGGVRSVGGAVWRADVLLSDADNDSHVGLVTNVSYSWTWTDHNVSAAAEFYRSTAAVNYVAGSVMVEMSPLWTVTPTLVANVDDPSALLQLVTRYSLGDNASFLASLNIPVGASGSEFGGPESAIPDRYLSFEAGLFAQLAWYF